MLIRAMFILGAISALGATANAGELSAADQELRARAIAECSSPTNANPGTPYINYAGGWFRCVEPGGTR